MEAVTVKGLTKMQQLVVTTSHAFVADEPSVVCRPGTLYNRCQTDSRPVPPHLPP